ncbi:aminoacyl-tRNA hydrolase [Polaribacter aquimarinus]|uniref:Peptidyl-tRNA hydrolase n=1 Tax=Polaribacter aquimarinus TaxID=2100726 RepID=A0A2U2JCF1_9FLAO|nr:aminoacyl-tRNA hydrolase [Polaribacter aquimarinus]PWG06026.1 aminoacyl-tRNA hydrolase [Polaribacter aquimarinus]
MNLRNFFSKLFGIKVESKEELMKKFLIVGLGNIGDKYTNTRHNIGFKILDEVAEEHNTAFETEKLGDIARFRFKGRTFILLKPSTFMNLSGKSLKYWMDKEKISLENLLVITDDVNIDFGTIRLKAKGSAGGHNGLKDIETKLGHQKYARFRFGVGANYSKGRQVDFVLGEWSKEETSQLIERLPTSAKVITSFGTAGLANTMNTYNGK